MTKQSTNMPTALLLLSVFSLKGQVQEGTTSQRNTMHVTRGDENHLCGASLRESHEL